MTAPSPYAAHRAIPKGVMRVVVRDVDFHHGNGTQNIFYDRPDVMFISLHGRPGGILSVFLRCQQ